MTRPPPGPLNHAHPCPASWLLCGAWLQGPRYVDASREWEVRYVSYSVVNMEGGKTTLSGLTDTDIERFYTQRWCVVPPHVTATDEKPHQAQGRRHDGSRVSQ